MPFILFFLLMTLSHSKMVTVLISISASPNKPHLHDPSFSKAYSILCSGSFTEHGNYCCSWPILCIFKFHLQSFLKWFHSTFTIYCSLCNLVVCLTLLCVPVSYTIIRHTCEVCTYCIVPAYRCSGALVKMN